MTLRLSLTGLAALLAAGLCCRAQEKQAVKAAALDAVKLEAAEPAKAADDGPLSDDAAKLEAPGLKKLSKEAEAELEAAAAKGKAEEAKKSKHGLPAEDEKLLMELVARAAKIRRVAMEKDLAARVKEIVAAAKLDEAGSKKLDALKPAALDAAMAEWSDGAANLIAPFILRGGGAEKALRSWTADRIAGDRRVKQGAAPDETSAWKEGMKAAFSAEQLAALEGEEKTRRDKLLKEFKDFLDASEDNAGQSFDMIMDKELQGILLYGSIDEERSKKLKEAAASAAKESIRAWRARAEKKLLGMDSASRDQLSQNNGLMGIDPEEAGNKPDNQPVWKDAVATLLKEDERKAIEARQGDVKKRRASALAMMIVGDADRYLGLSEDQRNKVLELSTEPMMKLPSTFFESPDNGGYYSLDVGDILEKVRGAGADKFKEFLSEKQMQRLRELTPAHLTRGYTTREYNSSSEKIEDETDVERVVSRFLYEESKGIRKRLLNMMDARIETIQRVAKPDDKAVATMRTAAKGAVEQWAAVSMRQLESWARQQFQNITPANAANQVRNLYNPYNNDRSQMVDPKIWTATLERALTKEQREAWNKESEARDAWRWRSLAEMTITEAEKRIIINPANLEELRTRIAEVLKTYEADINNYFSFGWHLQGYYSCIPFALLEDAELEKVFGKEQMEKVNDKLLPNARRYAEMIKQNHRSRTR